MKTLNSFVALLLPILFLLIGTPGISIAQDFKNPVEYMDFMGKEYSVISKDMWDYMRTVAHGKRAKKVENRRNEVLKTTLEAQRKISRMPAFNGDASMRDTVVAYLKLSYNVINEDYAKIVDMEEIAEQSYDLMEAYLMAQEQASQKLDAAFEKVKRQREAFAAKHNISLIDGKSKLGEKLEKASDVFKYYNTVYLIFFKSYKQEMYLLAAMESGDMSAMEQNKNALSSYSAEGLSKLDTLARYNNDLTLKQACIKMMEFYQAETAKQMPTLIDFYLKKENFEKVKAAFDAKKKSEISQADIDKFNNAVNEYNKAIAQFNATNQQLNDMRGKQLDYWNKTAQTFMDKHVPNR